MCVCARMHALKVIKQYYGNSGDHKMKCRDSLTKMLKKYSDT